MSRPAAPFVVVPARPGPLVAVGVEHRRDDLDVALDDVFGAPDDRGPGAADAALVAGGGIVAVAGLVASWPALVIVAGGAAVTLGLILPIRSAWRRLGARRHDAARVAQRTDGVLLRVGSGPVADLVSQHDRVRAVASGLPADERWRVEAAAHAAAREVATLLGEREPSGPAEADYVAARVAGLGSLAEAVAVPGAARAADVAARHEVEQIGGSSLDEVTAIVDEYGLRGRGTPQPDGDAGR